MALINFCNNNLLKTLFIILLCQSIIYHTFADEKNLSKLKEVVTPSVFAASINLARELEKIEVEDYPEPIESVLLLTF